MNKQQFFSMVSGYKIIETDYLCNDVYTQIKFPRSKKKRIRNKWSNNKKYFGFKTKYQIVITKDKTVYANKKIIKCLNGSFKSFRNNIVEVIMINNIPKPFTPYIPLEITPPNLPINIRSK